MLDEEKVLGSMSDFVNTNVEAVAILGARTVVLTKFLDAATLRLTAPQRVEVAASFRRGIEDALSMTDDIPLPAKYQDTLLQLTNTIVKSLSQ